MNGSWFYHEDGTTYGPMPESDIRALIDSGAIESTAMVRSDSDEKWIPLSESILSLSSAPAKPARSFDNGIAPPPQKASPNRSSEEGGIHHTKRKRGAKSFVIGIFVISLGVIWYFFQDQIKMAFKQVASNESKNIDAILNLSAELRAAHFQAAIQFPGQPEEQATFLAGQLRQVDITTCPPTLQVAYRDYINAWDALMVPDPSREDFRPLLFLIGKGDTSSSLPNGSLAIISAYNSLAEAAKLEAVYIKPIEN